MYPDWSFGDRVRKCRTTVGMTQEEFSAAIDVRQGSLAAWETDRAMPRSRQLIDICKRIEAVTNIPYAWLLGSEEPHQPPPANSAAPRREAPLVRHLRPVVAEVETGINDEALAYLRLAEGKPETSPSGANYKPVGECSDLPNAA